MDETDGSSVTDSSFAQPQVAAAEDSGDGFGAVDKPPWLDQFVWQSLWKVVAVTLITLLLLLLIWRTRHLLQLVGISVFFAIALIPAVRWMHERWGWKRGLAVGFVYAAGIIVATLLVAVLIPGVVEFAGGIGSNGADWVDRLNTWTQDSFGRTLTSESFGAEAASTAQTALSDWVDNLVGLATSGVGFLVDVATIALFTFYFAADAPRIQRTLLSRMPPQRQRQLGWVLDTAVQQTGGYFYSRTLLMVINGSLFFVVMLLVGMPVVYALPLSVFEGFFAEFIPAVGTYIGAAVPILITLAVQGISAALILLIWTIVYQLAENYFLSPNLSAKTMTLNGAVAFGAALAGGAIAGPMGAFMALPFAALITSIFSNIGKSYEVVYESKYRSPDERPSN
jgi:predicted PurR-regulated permease PerM